MSDILGKLFDALIIYGLFVGDSEEEEELKNDTNIISEKDNKQDSTHVSKRRVRICENDDFE